MIQLLNNMDIMDLVSLVRYVIIAVMFCGWK
jgi:bacterioferritin (cytochrome b1)